MLSNSLFFFSILVLINLFLIYRAYMYIVNLENCECFDTPNNNVNFDLLKFYEIYLGVGNLLLLLSLFAFSRIMKGGSSNLLSLNKMFIQVIVLICITLFYFVTINIIRIYKLIKEDCPCTQQWERLILYIQGFGSGVNLIQYGVQFTSYILILVLTLFMK